MKTKAFLSYCRQDNAKVNVLERYLRNLGLVVLRDNYDISVNDDIEFTIQKIVNSQCDLVVVALTNNSLASPWVKKELEFAERAKASGRPVEIIYVKLQAGTFVPESVQKRLFVDLALPDKDGKQDSLLRLAKYLLGRPPWIATGVYNVYTDVDDLNSRREDTDSDISCGINEFLTLAQHKITSIGLWFGAIFGMDQGAALVEVLRSRPFVEIDLYLPDPNNAPREQLTIMHESGAEAWNRVSERIDGFRKWGKSRGLCASEAARIRMHLLKFVPTASILAVDPNDPVGRMIVDLYAPGVIPSRQAKLELRHPQTAIYRTYLDCIQAITSQRMITETIGTSF